MPSSSFSEVDEHTGAGSRRGMCVSALYVCEFVCLGVERCGHMHSVSRQGSGTLKMSPESQKQKKTRRERRKCDEQTRMLWEVRDLETMEDRAVLSEWETGWNIKDGKKNNK